MTSAAADTHASAVCSHGTSATPSPAADQAYIAEPLLGSPFGAEVRNFSLTQPIDPSVVERIKKDVSRCVLWRECYCPVLPDVAPGTDGRRIALPQSDRWDVTAGTRSWCSETRGLSAERTRYLDACLPSACAPCRLLSRPCAYQSVLGASTTHSR